MLWIQMPGAFLVFAYQSFLIKTSISAGIPYLVTGIQQLILLILCMYYDYFYYGVNIREINEMLVN
jgi:hypothetical protein